jgi:hypothetical protein
MTEIATPSTNEGDSLRIGIASSDAAPGTRAIMAVAAEAPNNETALLKVTGATAPINTPW